jgi:hypothetical protein
MYWAERKGEDAGVRDFLAKIVDVNSEIANIDRKCASLLAQPSNTQTCRLTAAGTRTTFASL